MYALESIDFSDGLGIVVSELAPEEVDRQEQTLDTEQDPLELAVFTAA